MDSLDPREEAEECRRKALSYLGKPEAPFLLKVALEFDRIASEGSGKPSGIRPIPLDEETPNPYPDKDYSEKEQPFTDGDENDLEIDDE